jgi:protein-disulfide isomerase
MARFYGSENHNLFKLDEIEQRMSETMEVKKSNLDSIRNNPWMISTIVLGVLFLVTLFISIGGPGITGNAVVSETDIQAKVLAYATAQGVDGAKIDSVNKDSNAYTVTVDVNGQKVPLMLSLDGKYLLQPFDTTAQPSTGQPSSTGPVAISDDAIKNAPVKGNADAPITIIEFSDFQCPFCERAYQTLKQVEKDYVDTGKAKIVYMQYPLSFHPEAQKAAEASKCAQELGGDAAFWKMHDKLFENQVSLSVANEKKWAREIGLDGTKFDSCLDSGQFADEVQAEESYGASLGVTGTPGFFINGQELVGAQPYSAFKAVIDAELAK